MFGAENFYLELMDHQIPEETAAMKGLLEVSHLTGIPVVATNDCHYYKKDDWQVHEVHLCISTGSTLDDPKRFKMSTHELYFKSPEEMKQLFSHTPEAISNTVRIAERCHVEVPYGKSILPHFDIPKEFGPISTEDYLRMLCLEGIKKKMGEQIPRQYMLGTSRTNPYKKEGGVDGVRRTFDKLGLHALVAMGGEDTLGVANRLYNDFKFPVVGVPKTMDNDLSGTDYTFGFDSATSVAVDALARLRDTARSHRRVIVLEVMGRHAGWVSLFTAIAGNADYFCLPERRVDVDDMGDNAGAKGIYAALAQDRDNHFIARSAQKMLDLSGQGRRTVLDDDASHL